MNILHIRLVLISLIAGLLLGGCTQKNTRPVPPQTHASQPAKVTPEAPASHHHAVSRTTPTSEDLSNGSSGEPGQPGQTGIPACDDYLSSYIACHRAANIFAPGQLPQRYQAMRESLLRDAKNPDMRPQLAARCNSLARQLRDALHGKSCAVEPSPESSSP